MQQDIQTAWPSFNAWKVSNINPTTAQQIIDSATKCRRGVTVKAAIGNAGMIYVGNSDMVENGGDSTTGYELDAGESITVNVTDASNVYVLAELAGDDAFCLSV